MLTLCACSKKMLDPQQSTFVSDGHPCCDAKCYWYAEGRRVERQQLARQLERREQAARVVTFNPEAGSFC